MIGYQCGKCGAQMESPEAMKEEVCPSCGTLNGVPPRTGPVRCARCEKEITREDKVKLYNRELVCEECAAFLEDIEKVILPEATEEDLAAQLLRRVVRCAQCDKKISPEDKVQVCNGELLCRQCSGLSGEDFDNEKGQPSAIGGWLIIPAIGLILAPIKAAAGLFWGIDTIQRFTPELTGDPTLWLTGLIDAALIIACIVVAVLFFEKQRIAVPAFIGLVAAVPIAAAVQVALRVSLFGEADAADILKAIVGPCVYAAIWIPYFLLSKRVKNTFTE